MTERSTALASALRQRAHSARACNSSALLGGAPSRAGAAAAMDRINAEGRSPCSRSMRAMAAIAGCQASLCRFTWA